MLSFKDQSLSANFLSNEDIARICPMALKDTPTNPNVSNKYVQANTMTVINDLAKLGWYPVQAKQCRNKKGSAGVRSFHMVAFQNPNVKITKMGANGENIVDAYPRIILTNSHDGYNSFKFMVGLFRLVCSNGLVVADNQLVDMSIRHINYNFEELRKIVANAIEQVPNIVMTMNKMQEIELNDEQKETIAKEVIRIRKGIDDNVKFDIDKDTIRDILSPIREEDKGNDLWSVFNVCQEKLIKGGYMAINRGKKARKQRGITSIKKDMEFNQKLWGVASQYLAVAA